MNKNYSFNDEKTLLRRDACEDYQPTKANAPDPFDAFDPDYVEEILKEQESEMPDGYEEDELARQEYVPEAPDDVDDKDEDGDHFGYLDIK